MKQTGQYKIKCLNFDWCGKMAHKNRSYCSSRCREAVKYLEYNNGVLRLTKAGEIYIQKFDRMFSEGLIKGY
jgi:hypothetical protein